MGTRFALSILAITTSMSGTVSAQEIAAPDNNPPSGWLAPTIVLAPQPVQPDGAETVWSWVSGEGMLQASRRTTSGIGQPLPSAGARTKAVESCRIAAWSEAAKLGARDIEAVPAAPAKRDRWGRTVAPVHLRVTYLGLMWEVREAVMICTVDRNGQVVRAVM